jgi:Family of unknown function (DUF5670)
VQGFAGGITCWTVARPLMIPGRVQAARRIEMLWTIFVILMVMWLLGVTTSYTLGGFIHILLLLAIASVLIRIIQGRRVV